MFTDTTWMKSLIYNWGINFAIPLLMYVFDRAVSNDDGFAEFRKDPFLAFQNAIAVIPTSSFLRLLVLVLMQSSGSLLLSYFICPYISDTRTRLITTKFLIPMLIYLTITTAFKIHWAYPNVNYINRIYAAFPMILVVALVFIVCMFTRSLYLFIIYAILVFSLYVGQLNSDKSYSIYQELALYPTAVSIPFGVLLMVSTLVASWALLKFYGVHDMINNSRGTKHC